MHLVENGTVLLGHKDHEVNDTVGVAPLVVVPGNKFHEARVEHDAGLGVEDRGDGAGGEIR